MMKIKYFLLFLLLLNISTIKSIAQAPFPVGYSDLYTSGTCSKTIDLSATVGTTEGTAGADPSGGHNLYDSN